MTGKIETSTNTHYYLATDRMASASGMIGVSIDEDKLEDYVIRIYVGGDYGLTVEGLRFCFIDVTPLINFCQSREINIWKPSYYHSNSEKIKNIYEICIDLGARSLMLQAREEFPRLFNEIMYDNPYISYFALFNEGKGSENNE